MAYPVGWAGERKAVNVMTAKPFESETRRGAMSGVSGCAPSREAGIHSRHSLDRLLVEMYVIGAIRIEAACRDRREPSLLCCLKLHDVLKRLQTGGQHVGVLKALACKDKGFRQTRIVVGKTGLEPVVTFRMAFPKRLHQHRSGLAHKPPCFFCRDNAAFGGER